MRSEVINTSIRPTAKMEAGKEEKRGLVRFLTAEVVEGREIHLRMSAV